MANTGLSSSRQEEVLSYIKRYINENAYSPTVREIADGVGINSTSTVMRYLKILEGKGFIRKQPDSPRTIEVVDMGVPQGYDSEQVPLVREVLQKEQLFSKPNIRGYIALPSELLNSDESVFAYEAFDDSMSNIGISSGTTAFIALQRTVNSGDCVLCLVEGNPMFRFIYKAGPDSFRLVPASEDFEEETVSDFQLVGKVISLYKNLYGGEDFEET